MDFRISVFNILLLLETLSTILGKSEAGLLTTQQENQHFSASGKFIQSSVTFISSFLQQNVPHCDFIVVEDTLSKDLTDQLLYKISTSSDIGASRVLDMWSNISNGLVNPRRRMCEPDPSRTTLILIQSLRYDHISEHLSKLIIPRHNPLIRRDEDYFIFLGPEELTEELLMSSVFGYKIKYKVSPIERLQDSAIIFKSSSPYSNSGLPEMLSLTMDKDIPELNTLFPDVTKNHHGRAILMSCPKVPHHIELESSPNGLRPKRGFYKYWLEEVMNKFNFTSKFFISSGGGDTGIQLENGTWVGGVGDVLYGRAEMSFVVARIHSRIHLVDWSPTTIYEWFVFICQKPRHYFTADQILWTYSFPVWMGFLICTISVILALAFLGSYDSNFRMHRDTSVLGKSFGYVYASIMEQNSVDPGGNESSYIRTLCSFWLMFGLVMSTAYKAKLVLVIAFPEKSWVPRTFEELSFSNFKVGLNSNGRGGSAYAIFQSATDPIFHRIFSRMEIHPDAVECASAGLKQDFCCCTWVGKMYYYLVKSLTDKFGRSPVQISPTTSHFVDIGMIYERRAIFRKHFDQTIYNLLPMGLFDYWLKIDLRFIQSKSVYNLTVSQDQIVGPRKLRIVNLIGAFWILLFGFVAATFGFLSELFVSRYPWSKVSKSFSVY